MLYLLLAAAVFALDFGIKGYVDKNYRLREKHPCLKNKIVIEKYYNDGAALNFMARRPAWIKTLHTAVVVLAGIVFFLLLRTPGKRMAKTGLALLLGGGASNLWDRYAKGHVVDYFHINVGPKKLRNIIFNISDFCVFVGALLAAAGVLSGPGGSGDAVARLLSGPGGSGDAAVRLLTGVACSGDMTAEIGREG